MSKAERSRRGVARMLAVALLTPGSIVAADEVPVGAERLASEEELDRFSAQNGWVLDHHTGLSWTKTDERFLDWESAKAFCQSLEAEPQGAWTLPSIDELHTLWRGRPSVFSLQSKRHWTCNETEGGGVWIVGEGSKRKTQSFKSALRGVLCVAGVQDSDETRCQQTIATEICFEAIISETKGSVLEGSAVLRGVRVEAITSQGIVPQGKIEDDGLLCLDHNELKALDPKYLLFCHGGFYCGAFDATRPNFFNFGTQTIYLSPVRVH